MNETLLVGIVLAAIIAVVFVFAWAFARIRARIRPGTRKFIAWSAVVVTLPMLLIVGVSTHKQFARETLHEVILEGTPAGVLAEPAVHVVRFGVVHPDVEHAIEISPEYQPPIHRYSRPGFPIALAYELRAPGGEVLAQAARTLDKSLQQARHWDDEQVRFTPAAAGPHELEITLKTPGIPSVRVRVVDPLYTEGVRAEGY